MPTSSAALPGLIIQMLRHMMIDDGMDVGYGTAVLATRLGDSRVTSIDVDSYLTKAAAERLDGIGLRPQGKGAWELWSTVPRNASNRPDEPDIAAGR